MFRTALVVYWLNILALGAALWWTWQYVRRAGLLEKDTPANLDTLVMRRIGIGQALYAFGALLCIFSTYLSIGFIILVQLNYAIAPRIGVLRRL